MVVRNIVGNSLTIVCIDEFDSSFRDLKKLVIFPLKFKKRIQVLPPDPF